MRRQRKRNKKASVQPFAKYLSQCSRLSTYLGHNIKITDMENQCKVSHHTFESFSGKSPKQSKLILSEPKNAIPPKDEGSKAMTVALSMLNL